MKIKHVLATLTFSMAAGFAAFGLANHQGKVAEETKAATDTTVFLAVDKDALINKYSIADFKLYLSVNYKGDGDDWSAIEMTLTEKTYESMPVYSVEFTDKYNGLGCMQFQVKDGTTWKEEDQVFGKYDWHTADKYNGKLHVYGGTGWVEMQETHVYFATPSGESTVVGEELDYNSVNGEYEGAISLEIGDKFKIRKTVDDVSTDYIEFGTNLSDYFSKVDGWIVTSKAGVFMVYFKGDNTMWIDNAGAELIAYAYAGYFLSHVQCQYPDVPKGWSDASTRYASSALTDDARDYLYAFDVEATRSEKPTDNIVLMFDRYNLACYNHTGLDRFIKNSSGEARDIPSFGMNKIVSIPSDNTVLIITVISSVSLIAVASFFMLEKKKESK